MLSFCKKTALMIGVVSLVSVFALPSSAVAIDGAGNSNSDPSPWTNTNTNLTNTNLGGDVICKDNNFLGFPTWYRGLTESETDCNIKSPAAGEEGLSKFVWTIVFNVVEAGMVLAVYVSVGFIIAGGIKFLTSRGSSDGIAKAKSTITNAIIGLIISILAVAIVDFFYKKLKDGV